MSILKDEGAQTYGIVMFMVFLAIGIFLWMFVGIIIDLLESTFNSISYMMSATLANRVTDAVNIYSYIPYFLVITGVIFLIVIGLKKNETIYE